MCYSRRLEKISCTDRVRNDAVSHRDTVVRNIQHRVRRRKANGIGQIFCGNCLLKHFIDGKGGVG
jgi:hypothetical protein